MEPYIIKKNSFIPQFPIIGHISWSSLIDKFRDYPGITEHVVELHPGWDIIWICLKLWRFVSNPLNSSDLLSRLITIKYYNNYDFDTGVFDLIKVISSTDTIKKQQTVWLCFTDPQTTAVVHFSFNKNYWPKSALSNSDM